AIALALAIAAVAATVAVRRSSRRPGPVDRSAAVARARRLLAANRPELALRAVTGIDDGDKGAAEAATIAGFAAVRLGRLDEARVALERALRLDPAQPLSASVLAAICLDANEADVGLHWLRVAAAHDPKDPRPWLGMGKVQADLGHDADAEAAFAEALRRAPDDPEARAGRARALLGLGRADEAGEVLADGLRDDAGDSVLLGLAARQALDSGGLDRASELADRALDADPDNLDALRTRARTRLALGRDADALDDAEHAARVAPTDLAALQLRAQVEARLGLADRSARTIARHDAIHRARLVVATLTEQVARHPDDPDLRHRLGQAADAAGFPLLALKSYRFALKLRPDHPLARAALADLEARREATSAPP
ncbi:MAG TPA: tetratricopeptide repeat protein, partial [Isosphaeraceae bacterium]|nr:tetratricopeptide repeat protein [Isosphaeraceae bacterium]